MTGMYANRCFFFVPYQRKCDVFASFVVYKLPAKSSFHKLEPYIFWIEQFGSLGQLCQGRFADSDLVEGLGVVQKLYASEVI